MDYRKAAAIVAAGLTLCGCDGTLDSLSASSTQNAYPAASYYGAPVYSTPGYYSEPYHGAPYGYQPGYAYRSPSGGGNDWRERDRHERTEQAFRNEGHQSPVQPSPGGRVSSMGGQPQHLAAQPAPAATSQTDQNKKLIDQLGFRPSR